MADPTAPAAQATTAATAPTTESAPIAAISPDAAAAAKDGVASQSDRPSRLLVHQQQPPRLRARPDGLARAAEAMKAQLAAKAAEAPKTEPKADVKPAEELKSLLDEAGEEVKLDKDGKPIEEVNRLCLRSTNSSYQKE